MRAAARAARATPASAASRCEIEVEPAGRAAHARRLLRQPGAPLSLLAPHESLARARDAPRSRPRSRIRSTTRRFAPAAERRLDRASALRASLACSTSCCTAATRCPELAARSHGLEPARDSTPSAAARERAVAWSRGLARDRFATSPARPRCTRALDERSREQRAGVCQDFAHLWSRWCARGASPARYVMGYVDPGAPTLETGTQATHAWAEVLIPGAGWRGFDATAGLVANDTYVPVAVGRDSRRRRAAARHLQGRRRRASAARRRARRASRRGTVQVQ